MHSSWSERPAKHVRLQPKYATKVSLRDRKNETRRKQRFVGSREWDRERNYDLAIKLFIDTLALYRAAFNTADCNNPARGAETPVDPRNPTLRISRGRRQGTRRVARSRVELGQRASERLHQLGKECRARRSEGESGMLRAMRAGESGLTACHHHSQAPLSHSLSSLLRSLVPIRVQSSHLLFRLATFTRARAGFPPIRFLCLSFPLSSRARKSPWVVESAQNASDSTRLGVRASTARRSGRRANSNARTRVEPPSYATRSRSALGSFQVFRKNEIVEAIA